MSKIVLKKIFERSTKKEKECCICFDKIKTHNDAFIMYNCCGKMFHNTCITKNIIYNNFNCPLCNYKINIIEQKNILTKFATANFLYENFKDMLCNVSGHTIKELDNLYNSKTDLNSIIQVNFINENENNHDDDNDECEITEQQLNKILCYCYKCRNQTLLHVLNDTIINENVEYFFNTLRRSDLDILYFSYESKLYFVCYCIENNSINILNAIIRLEWINELQIEEEIFEIYNLFVDKMEGFYFETSKFIMDNFTLCISKQFLDEVENEYKNNGDGNDHEIFKNVRNNYITYTDPDGYIEYHTCFKK